MVMKKRKYDIKDFHQYVAEASERQSIWHPDAWENCAFRDGIHWKPADYRALKAKGINPITVNRVFPVVNLILGYNIINPSDVVAKGRTQMDSEISQVMSEGMAYVLDQCAGRDKINQAYADSVVPGFGVCMVDENPDPRRETVCVKYYPWYTMGWDIYGDSWMDPDSCRYVYYSDWKDVDDIIALFPEKEKEIEDEFSSMSGGVTTSLNSPTTTFSLSDYVEQQKSRLTGAGWADKTRRRCKPVELYYTVKEECLFSRMEDGTYMEVDSKAPINQQYDILQRGIEHLTATVNKIRRVNFIGKVILEDIPSPHPHDMYPHVPFYGYLDRFGMPFGVPQQIKEQNMEVNKRRSMALALLDSRRVTIEKEATEDNMKAYKEANRRDGFIEMEKDKMDKIKIEDLSELSVSQVSMMNISEREIKEIAGANDESLGYETSVMSGVALENKREQSNTMTASLLANKTRSQVMMGERIISGIKKNWTGPKVLRITDRRTGADRFIELNKIETDANGEVLKVRNNIVDGRFDCVVSSRPMTDTVRERNVQALLTALDKATPEYIPVLINMIFELSDLPQKELLMRQLQQMSGVEPIDSMLSQEELDARQLEKQKGLDAKNAADADYERRKRELELEKMKAEVTAKLVDAKTKEQEANTDEYETGFKLQQDIMKQRDTGYPVSTRQ